MKVEPKIINKTPAANHSTCHFLRHSVLTYSNSLEKLKCDLLFQTKLINAESPKLSKLRFYWFSTEFIQSYRLQSLYWDLDSSDESLLKFYWVSSKCIVSFWDRADILRGDCLDSTKSLLRFSWSFIEIAPMSFEDLDYYGNSHTWVSLNLNKTKSNQREMLDTLHALEKMSIWCPFLPYFSKFTWSVKILGKWLKTPYTSSVCN